MRVLFILPEFEPHTGGGICTYYKALLNEFQQNAIEITIIQGSAFESRGGSSNWNGIDIHYLSHEQLKRHADSFRRFDLMPEFQNHIASSWAIYELANSLGIPFDVVISTDWGLGFIPWVIYKQVPVIVHLHGSIGQIDHFEPRPGWELWSDLYLKIEIDFLSDADALITHSNQNIRFWENTTINSTKFSLIPPAFEIPKALVSTTVTSPKITGLVVGRIQYWKGPIQLCEAIRQLSDRDKDNLKIYWVGRDTFYHAEKLGMDEFLTKTYPDIWRNIIQPVGSKNRSELQSFYNQIDFAIVPSTWDMFNIAAIEHLMNRKTLICSTGAGASDFLSDCKDILVFNNTPSSLTESLKMVLGKSREELAIAGEKGYLFANSIFDKKEVQEQHLRVMREAIENFEEQESLENKYSWLMPKASGPSLKSSKEVLLDNWPLKEVLTLSISRFIKKFKKTV